MTIAVIRPGGSPVIRIGENTAEAARQANLAAASADDAAASAAVALAAAGPNYPDTAAGLAATTVGEAFAVDNGDDTITVYSHDAGPVATELRTFPKDILAMLASTDAGKGAGLFSFEDGKTGQDLANTDDGEGADLVAFLQYASAAEPRTTRDKTAERVDVFDALTPTMRASVRSGNLAVDCSPAINAIVNYANGGENTGDATGGTTLHFKGSRYLCSSTISNTWRADEEIIDDGDLRRLNIEGDGSANTSIFFDGPDTDPLYSVAGYHPSADGRDLYHTIKGLRLRRMWGMRQEAVGIKLRHVADINLEDVHVDGFDLGIDAQDVLGFTSDRLYILGNNTGLWARLVDWTNPNHWMMLNGKVSGNQVCGLRFTAAANIFLERIRFEANCDDRATHQVVLFENGPGEGSHWATVRGGYFENNNCLYDINVTNNGTNSGTVLIEANSFNKTSAARYSKTHVNFATIGGGVIKAALIANGWRSFNDYSPSSSNRVYIIQGAGVQVEECANLLQNSAEAPNTNDFPVSGRGMFHPAARALITNNGTTAAIASNRNGNIASATRTGPGVVDIVFKTAMLSNNYFVNARQNGGAGYGVLSNNTTSGCTITMNNTSAAATDMNFNLEIWGDYA